MCTVNVSTAISILSVSASIPQVRYVHVYWFKVVLSSSPGGLLCKGSARGRIKVHINPEPRWGPGTPTSAAPMYTWNQDEAAE